MLLTRDLFSPPETPGSGFPRMPTILERRAIATSHPLATLAGARAFDAGGNAIDAALAAAATLTVVEPTENGLGGDAFAMGWYRGALFGINGSGAAPSGVPEGARVHEYGPKSVTVPGAVRLWADLSEKYGRLGFDRSLSYAIDLATTGTVCTARISDLWHRAFADGRAPWPPPSPGERYLIPGLADVLRALATDGPDAFYTGCVAKMIADATWVTEDDLSNHRSDWVVPLVRGYGEYEICEMPPNTQGPAALLALALAEDPPSNRVDRLHLQIESIKLATREAYHHIGDQPLPTWFLDSTRIDRLRADISGCARVDGDVFASNGDTAYLCCIDEDRNAVSLIQSIYHRFGSGVLAGDSGIVLHNRAAGFVETNQHPNMINANRRPFHTLIPAVILRDGRLVGVFGVMGGAMQPQGHLQVIQNLIHDGRGPQSALDSARFRVDGDRLLLEPGLWHWADALERRGHSVLRADNPHPFGVGQILLSDETSICGGSDGRGDGLILGR